MTVSPYRQFEARLPRGKTRSTLPGSEQWENLWRCTSILKVWKAHVICCFRLYATTGIFAHIPWIRNVSLKYLFIQAEISLLSKKKTSPLSLIPFTGYTTFPRVRWWRKTFSAKQVGLWFVPSCFYVFCFPVVNVRAFGGNTLLFTKIWHRMHVWKSIYNMLGCGGVWGYQLDIWRKDISHRSVFIQSIIYLLIVSAWMFNT